MVGLARNFHFNPMDWGDLLSFGHECSNLMDLGVL